MYPQILEMLEPAVLPREEYDGPLITPDSHHPMTSSSPSRRFESPGAAARSVAGGSDGFVQKSSSHEGSGSWTSAEEFSAASPSTHLQQQQQRGAGHPVRHGYAQHAPAPVQSPLFSPTMSSPRHHQFASSASDRYPHSPSAGSNRTASPNLAPHFRGSNLTASPGWLTNMPGSPSMHRGPGSDSGRYSSSPGRTFSDNGIAQSPRLGGSHHGSVQGRSSPGQNDGLRRARAAELAERLSEGR